MSVRIASTCLPSTNARYSAAVSANRGVSRRCVDESLARLRKSAVRSSAPPCSRLRRKYSALSYGTPIPAKTIAKSPPSPCRSRAWLAISTASRSCGSPPPEKSGSFWPRTRLFIRSSVVIAGLDEVTRHRPRDRIDRQPVDRIASARRDRRAAVDDLAHAVEHAAEDARREPNDSGSPMKRTTVSRERQPRRGFQHLDRHEIAVDRGDTAKPRAAVGAADLDRLVQADVERAPEEQERPLRAAWRRLQP